MKRLARYIRSDIRGVTAVEFALVAPVFLMFMFLIIDGARAAWTYQTLQQVATDSARCAGLGATGCKTLSEVQSYAVARAGGFGVPLTTASVALSTTTPCSTVTGMTMVTITTNYQGATTKLLPAPVSSLTTYSCFPTAS